MLKRLLIIVLLTAASACASGANRIDAGYFPETIDERAEVDAVLARAAASDRLALIVIGANWCHDSTALMKSLEDPAVARVVAESYETGLVNVELFANGFDTAERFGLPIYTHTPTVLIVDPETERLVNWDDQYLFRDAYKMTTDDVLGQLRENADRSTWREKPRAGTGELDAWAGGVAGRIRDGYEYLASFGSLDAPEIKELWPPLRELRYSFGEDHAAALLAVAAGEAPLLPDYEPLPWEEGDGATSLE